MGIVGKLNKLDLIANKLLHKVKKGVYVTPEMTYLFVGDNYLKIDSEKVYTQGGSATLFGFKYKLEHLNENTSIVRKTTNTKPTIKKRSKRKRITR